MAGTLCGAVDLVAREDPTSTAMSLGPARLTYGELSELSGRVASGLLASGVRRSVQPVATYMRRGPLWYCAYIGASRLGVPVAALSVDLATDPEGEQRRNEQLLELRPQVLVADGSVEFGVPVLQVVELLRGAPWAGGAPDTEDLLCYCHTGGSTGRQRCVAVTHAMAAHEIRRYPAALALPCTGQRVLQPSSPFWAAALFGQLDLAVALRGCAVVTEAVDALDLAAVVREEAVTVVGLPPTLLAVLEPVDVAHEALQCVISWGEACPLAVAQRWGGAAWGFYDLLIATEYWLALVASARDECGSLFEIVPDVEILVRGSDGECVEGEVGELCLAGPGVCKAFVGEAFEGAPGFTLHQGRRFYCSGDLVLRRSLGRIAFAGRGDEVVKIAGRWVDLAALARRLIEVDGVAEAVALSAPGLCCICLAPSCHDLRAAQVMLPSGVDLHIVDALPRHPATQKVDRLRLQLALPGRAPAPPRCEPFGPLGDLLHAVAGALGLSELSGDEAFLALPGGDSAAAVRAAAAASRAGFHIRAVDLLRARSLRSLVPEARGLPGRHSAQGVGAPAWAAWPLARALPFLRAWWPREAPGELSGRVLARAMREAGLCQPELLSEVVAQLGIVAEDVEEICPCMPLQDYMLAALDADSAHGAGCAGLLQSTAILGRDFDVERFRGAWDVVWKSRAVLRTAFALVRSRYWQVALRPRERPPWRLSSLSGDVHEALREDAAAGFAPRGPMHRLACLALPDGRRLFLLTIHNALCDAWSSGELLNDVLAHYCSQRLPARPPFAEVLRRFQERDAKALARHWREALAGFRPRSSRSSRSSRPPGFCERALGSFSWEELVAQASALRVTPAALIHAAWALVSAQRMGTADIVIGTVLSGREAVGEEVLGTTLALVPLRVRFTEGEHLVDVLRRVQASLVELLDVHDCSLSEIRRWAGLGRAALFASTVVFENAPGPREELLRRSGFVPHIEREVPVSHSVPELRVSRAGGRLRATLQGRLPPRGGELLEDFEASLQALAACQRPAAHRVGEVLSLLPLLRHGSVELAGLRHWGEVLRESDSAELPTDAPRCAGCPQLRSIRWSLEGPWLQGSSEAAVLFVWLQVLADHAGRRVCVGVPHEGEVCPVLGPSTPGDVERQLAAISALAVPWRALERALRRAPFAPRALFAWRRKLPPGELGLAVSGHSGEITYDSRVLEESTVRRLLRRLLASLQGVEAPRSDFGVATSPPMLDVGVSTLLRQQMRRTPHALAISSTRELLTYGRLDLEARHLAARISEAMGSEGAAGVLAERSAGALVALVAALYAGVAYCPLSPSAPEARLRLMVSSADVRLILAETLSLAASLGVAVLRIERRRTPAPAPPRFAEASRPMYVLFTSGSTGVPKAVRVAQGAALSHLLAMAAYGYGACDVGLQHTSLAWVAAMPEVWGPLLFGGCLALPRCPPQDLEGLAACALASGASLLQLVPSVLGTMLHAGCSPLGAACRHLVLTGEPLPRDLCEQLEVPVWNHYGQTEAADTTTTYRARRPLPRAANVPIGRPAPHRQLWLESERPGASQGEILVAGPGLMLASPAAQALRDSERSIGCALASGDLGRWSGELGDELLCLGRSDRQVKLRGHRVELAEVELVLREEAARLGEAAEVVVMPHGEGLLAYLRPRRLAGEELLRACRERLLPHAVPSALHGVEDWPRTSTGKLDRRALPRHEAKAVAAALRMAPPAIVPRARLWAKGGRAVALASVVGLLAGRARPLRTLLLPYLWAAYAAALAWPQRRTGVFADEPPQAFWLPFFVLSALLPQRCFLFGALLGALSARGAWPLLWWLGLGAARRELEWYSWYLTPQGAPHAPGALAAFARGAVAAFGPARPELRWDEAERRPRRRPRLERIDVDGPAVAARPAAPAPRLSPASKALLGLLEREAGVEVSDVSLPLSSLFDSLRLTAFVASVRRLGLPLSLADALQCDTVKDLLLSPVLSEAPRTQSPRSPESPESSTRRYFRLREWGYMLRLSVCWSFEATGAVDEARLRLALERLTQRHEALRAELADPLAVWDLAVEASSNFAVLRELALGRGPSRPTALQRAVERGVACLGGLLFSAWPRTYLPERRAPKLDLLDVVDCGSAEELERRSAWLLDGRHGHALLTSPLRAVLLRAPGAPPRLHVIMSHGFADGFSVVPLLGELREDPGAPLPSVFALLEQRLRDGLAPAPAPDAAELCSWAFSEGAEAFDHFLWLTSRTLLTLRSTILQRRWCCSLDVALLSVVVCAISRLRGQALVRLRLLVSMRDGPEEGLLIGDLADHRDLDIEFPRDATVEEAALAVAGCIRQRRWRLPEACSDPSQRVFLNFRPLLQDSPQGARDPLWRHRTLWPPTHGERNWDRRTVYNSLWVMADQVDELEWVLCLKVQWGREEDAQLGDALGTVVEDLARRSDAPLIACESGARE